MSWVLILVIVVVVVVVVVAVLVAVAGKKAGTGSKVGFPYVPAKALFSPAERSFLGVLDQVVGSEHRIFGKVRVADLAAVKPGLGAAERQGALNRVAAKHFDFVVCRASDLSVICAVELNDSSHSSKYAQARDELLTNVCEAIGLPLFQVTAKRAYSVQELQAQFASVIGVTPAVAPVTSSVRDEK
ncbi:Protein of unknown function [Nitrosomonas eutropha]|uniref:DUF2726 domain-containing protein n=1 Tax=Nitrosomonas eutropha TaxID=916 RepID=UPI00088E22E9|nr:DUF2726 domain-containing protein [Nitrosomonas eutropha]SCX25169.1 Protein of unknown function [Nitrosomonas eutropha]